MKHPCSSLKCSGKGLNLGWYADNCKNLWDCVDKDLDIIYIAITMMLIPRPFCKIQVSYNIMINVFACGGLYKEAEELFKAMQRDGCSPDSFTYLSFVRAYTESRKYSEAEETINSMQKNGVPASCTHFNLLFSAFAKAGVMPEAERVYNKMLGASLKPDLACYRSMLRGYMDYGHVEEGIEFFERMSESAEADRFIMSCAVHLYKSAGKGEKSASILESMGILGIGFLENLEVGSKQKVP